MTAIVNSPRVGNDELQARPQGTARRRFATAAVVAAAMIAGVLGWRWALIEATTEDGPADSLTSEPALRPTTKHSPPPIELEVTVLDVRSAAPPRPEPAKASAPAARVPARPASTAKTRR